MENTQLFRRGILSRLSLLGEIGPNEMVFLSISTALVQYIILSGVSSGLTYPSIPPGTEIALLLPALMALL